MDVLYVGNPGVKEMLQELTEGSDYTLVSERREAHDLLSHTDCVVMVGYQDGIFRAPSGKHYSSRAQEVSAAHETFSGFLRDASSHRVPVAVILEPDQGLVREGKGLDTVFRRNDETLSSLRSQVESFIAKHRWV